MRSLLANEWSSALSGLDAATLESAIGRVIKTQKFWPTVSEVLEAAKAYDYRTAEEKYGPRHTRHRAPKDFCREGRTEAEEMAYRAAQVLRMKTEASEKHPPAPEETASVHVPKAASQAMWISDELRAIAKKRGYYTGSEA